MENENVIRIKTVWNFHNDEEIWSEIETAVVDGCPFELAGLDDLNFEELIQAEKRGEDEKVESLWEKWDRYLLELDTHYASNTWNRGEETYALVEDVNGDKYFVPLTQYIDPQTVEEVRDIVLNGKLFMKKLPLTQFKRQDN